MLRRVGWLILAWFALSASWEALALAGTPWSEIGQPFRYTYRSNLGWVIVHGVSAVTALLVGTLQLLRTSGSGHRWLGRVYGVAVLLGELTGFQMGLRVMGARGLFCLVAAAWLWTMRRDLHAMRPCGVGPERAAGGVVAAGKEAKSVQRYRKGRSPGEVRGIREARCRRRKY